MSNRVVDRIEDPNCSLPKSACAIQSPFQNGFAFIYIRQSTVDQLVTNHESRRRQYGLAERARTLGWTDVTVIDDDLGRSGSGVSRPCFERLLATICEGHVGAVFAIEASRLARNWHTLIEFCGLDNPGGLLRALRASKSNCCCTGGVAIIPAPR